VQIFGGCRKTLRVGATNFFEMKFIKLFFASAFLLSMVSAANAQIFVGGSFNFSSEMPKTTAGSTTTDGDRETNFTLAPSVGYFMSEKIAVGASVSYTLDRTKESGSPETIESRSIFGIAPFARYYALQMGNVSVFAQGTLALGFGSETIKVDGTKSDLGSIFAIGLSVAPAISYDLGEKLSLEARLGGLYFQHMKDTDETDDSYRTTNSWGLNANLSSISFGVIYKL